MSIISNRPEFEFCLNKFYSETNSCPNDLVQWEIEKSQTILKQPFLRRNMLIVVSKRPTNVDIDIIFNKDEEDDCVIQDTTEIIQLEHHIVYSTSYQVPVIYFKASFSDGAPLSHEQIFQYIVPDSYQSAIISQNDHPILGIPFWYVHPCDTRTSMKALTFDQPDYIKVWLSVYGPIVKCNIPTSMFLPS